jgi:hypothetical protein
MTTENDRAVLNAMFNPNNPLSEDKDKLTQKNENQNSNF